MAKDLLSDAKVRNAKPKDKPYKLFDGGGLFLLVQPTGSKLWRYKFRLGGKHGLFAIGRYPETTLTGARAAREVARELVKQGVNPAHQRKADKRERLAQADAEKRAAQGAFGKVADAWLEHAKDRKGRFWAAGTLRAKKARVNRFLKPALESLPMDQIGATEIRPILEKAQTAGAWSAVHVKGDLSAIFDYAVAKGLAAANPIPGLRGLTTIPESESKAVLTPEQIRKFFTKLGAYRGYPETAHCLRLIALTACRPGEAANAEWSEFDLDTKFWRRSAEKMKARRDHLTPLSKQSLALLEEIRPISGECRYLFPHRTKDKTHATAARLAYAMRDMDLGKGASPHCWRTTFSTWANENGFRPDAIERQLAHVESNRVRATYNKALLVDERRTMLQAWADYLDALQSGGNVVPLQRAKSK